MSHYCCKRCGQRYDDCACPPLSGVINKNLFDMAAMTTDPKMPEPAYTVSIHGRWHEAAPHPPAFDLPDGAHTLITTAAAQAYAEALAAARVAKERERWATAARLCVQATPEQLPMALDALADVLSAQPPETGKRK